MSSVTVSAVTKTFGDSVAVESLSLGVADKEFVVLLGPSGCGKTTTLNMIAGLETPTSGSILIDGKSVEHLPAERRDISMVFQTIALYPHMSAFRNIGFPLKMASRPKLEIAKRVLEVARLLRIEGLLDRRPYELSGGERQRVALGRAIVRNPSVFLFDEPLSSLDAKLRADMRLEIKTLHRRLGATFIYVTHDQVEAMTMADRIAVIDHGRLQQYGPLSEIYERPVNTMVAGFVGSPSMNLIAGKVRERPDGIWFESDGFSLRLLGPAESSARTLKQPQATLGVRPEAAIIGDGDGSTDTEGWVFATEPVGSDLYLDICFDYADTPDRSLIADTAYRTLIKVRTSPNAAINVGDRIPLILPSNKLLLFDDAGTRVHPS
jgi:multiple sugar transport system ATP-binding protein